MGDLARRRVLQVIVGFLVGLVGCMWLFVARPGAAEADTTVTTVSASAPTAGAVPSNQAQSPVHLAVVASQASYRPGAPVSLRATVQNLSTTTCAMEASADGALTVLKATRDGAAVSPSFTQADLLNGAAELVTAHIQSVAPHGTTSFTTTTEPMQSGSAFTLFTPQSDQSAVATYWSTAANGHYVLDLTYQVPALAGSSACGAQSNTVAVSFRVGASSSGPNVLIYGVAGGAVVILLAGVVIFGRSRRRRRRAQAMVAVGALLIGLLASGVVTPAPARADVTGFGGGPAGAAEFAACKSSINGYDPNFLPGLGTVLVTITSSGPTYAGTDAVYWNYTDTSHFPGDKPGVNAVPCASLYHELTHIKDGRNGTPDGVSCNETNGVPYKEADTTNRENGYRAYLGEDPRTTYGSNTLPPTLEHCGYVPRAIAAIKGWWNGDPHLTTFDGERYDFQAVGEFDAVTSATGDLQVQVRQSPFQGSTTVSVNSAIAIDVAGTRLGFYLEDGLIDVHRGGQSIQVPVGRTTLTNGATLMRTSDPYLGDNYQIQWADGTVATVWRASIYGLVVTLAPATSRAGTLSGMLGDFDGNPKNDVAARGGSPITPTFDTLYPSVADSWRVTSASSLFDYPAGETTATFTDRSFPSRPTTAADLSAAQRSPALAACQAAGLTDPTDLADCTLDVAVTGSASFGITTAAIERETSATSQPGPTTAPTTPVAQPGVVTAQSDIASPGAIAKTMITGHKGDRVLVDVTATTLPEQCRVITLRGADDNIVASGCTDVGTSIQGAVLPADGPYTVYVAPTDGATGTATLKIVTSQDQVQTTTIDGPPITASVTEVGQVSSIGFTASSGQTIFITASAVTVPSECGSLSLVGPDGGAIGLGCVSGGTATIDRAVLTATGTYQVVVNPKDDGLGSATIKITSVQDQTVSATVGGPPVNVAISQPGARGLVTFTATAGQRVTVSIADATLPDQCGVITLLEPDQATLTTGCIAGGSGSFTTNVLRATGTYTLIVDPYASAIGTLRISVASA